ncbi:MAG: HD domain-containing protein [Clostridiales bacterium]|nr:HD domain-containing protein [Clostridiales bacterium]
MDFETLLKFLGIAEKLKCNTRHSWTSSGRHESVAEHSFRLIVFAWLVKEEFKELDMDKVMKMCIFHDFGEALTGDIPSFEKQDSDRKKEDQAVNQILEVLPSPYKEELSTLFEEMNALETEEAKLYKSLDRFEAVIQHDEADLSTWLPLEYELNLTYGEKEAKEFNYTKELHAYMQEITKEKIRKGKA